MTPNYVLINVACTWQDRAADHHRSAVRNLRRGDMEAAVNHQRQQALAHEEAICRLLRLIGVE